MKKLVSIAMVALALAFPAPAPAEDTPDLQPVEATPTEPERLSRLQGSAFLGRNRQVVGATVMVQPREDPTRVFLTTSDGKGRFRVEGLADGTYRVEIRRLGLQPVVKDDVGLKFPFRSVVELPMQRAEAPVTGPAGTPVAAGGREPVTVEGDVRDRDGGSLAEIRVRLVRADGKIDPREVRSTPTGSFRFADLEPGSWRLEATGVGFLPLRIPLDVEADTSVRLALVPQPADYVPSPLELMPPEEPIAPERLGATLPDY